MFEFNSMSILKTFGALIIIIAIGFFIFFYIPLFWIVTTLLIINFFMVLKERKKGFVYYITGLALFIILLTFLVTIVFRAQIEAFMKEPLFINILILYETYTPAPPNITWGSKLPFGDDFHFAFFILMILIITFIALRFIFSEKDKNMFMGGIIILSFVLFFIQLFLLFSLFLNEGTRIAFFYNIYFDFILFFFSFLTFFVYVFFSLYVAKKIMRTEEKGEDKEDSGEEEEKKEEVIIIRR